MDEMDKKNSNDSKVYKKWWFWAIIVVIVLAISSGATNSDDGKDTASSSENSVEVDENREDWVVAMKKCMVMEGADIYNTGIGKKSNNVFDDARETCNGWYNDWGEDEFYSAVNEDWSNRQNEEIDGKPLTYYIEILNF